MRGSGPFIVLAVVLMIQPQVLSWLMVAYVAVLVVRAWE